MKRDNLSLINYFLKIYFEMSLFWTVKIMGYFCYLLSVELPHIFIEKSFLYHLHLTNYLNNSCYYLNHYLFSFIFPLKEIPF